MEYQVLARKWRPQCFADVVGQKHITQTLQSELMQDRTAHAYLFVGPRGIGKTSIARIFAKALNCKNAPVKEPCCQCESCVAIAEGHSLDLIEIDGASNNSVDDIRQLREEVLYSPTSSRFKIYIIDEVHMLSNNAWNALLKTIEEPPPHAKFLFATTEAHKVLPTVVSRCQRFDLQRITFKLITEQMRKIAQAENVTISDAAIEVIARAADGGMRDAQSLLDQMIAFTSVDQSEISEEQALAIFGLTGVAEMEKLMRAITSNDRPALIASIHHIAAQGKNLEKLFEDILVFLRGIQICLLMKEPENILEVGDDLLELYKRIASSADPNMIQKLLEELSPVGRMLHDALNKQVFLETILLKAMRIAHAVDINTLIHRLNQLRKGGELLDLEKIPSLTQQIQQTVVPQENIAHTVQTAVSTTAVHDSDPLPVAPTVPVAQEASPAVESVSITQPQTVASDAVVASSPSPVESPVVPKEPSALSRQVEAPVVSEVNNQEPLSVEPVMESIHEVSDSLPPETMPPSVPEPEVTADSVEEQLSVGNEPAVQEPIGFDSLFSEPPAVVSDSVTEEPDALEHTSALTASRSESPASVLESSGKTNEAPQTESQGLYALDNPKEKSSEKSERNNTTVQDENIATPESVWHAAIVDMGHCQQPLLQAYMQDGRPASLHNGELTVVYDEESASMHIAELKKAKPLIETCLRRVSGNKSMTLNVSEQKGVISPLEVSHSNHKDLAEVQKRAENNPFVKDVMEIFEGTIVDVKG